MTSLTSTPGAADSGLDAGALPDPHAKAGPYRAFASDPGWNEAWWWLAVPLLLAIALIAVNAAAPDFYLRWILPEGYGVLEVGHFFIPLAAAGLAARLAIGPYVRRRPLVLAYVLLAAFGCVYIAGEEHSWGQHFFYWDTPAYWAEINRQQETNLHNLNEWLNHKPRTLLEVGIFVGGVALPLAARFYPRVRRNRWSLFIPADALVPVALGALLFNGIGKMEKLAGVHGPVPRPAEATETYIYLFLLFYMIVFARRIEELRRGRQT